MAMGTNNMGPVVSGHRMMQSPVTQEACQKCGKRHQSGVAECQQKTDEPKKIDADSQK